MSVSSQEVFEDLMRVLADIDEADVGQLTTESKVNFTVDAFPTETFEGRIAQIRLAPQVVQNVTTYTAVINVSNPDGKLMPGMTANVTAITAERNNVLTIPNAALRFRPSDQKSGNQQPRQQKAANRSNGGAVVWRVQPDKELQPVRVTLGLTNGTATEVTGGDLHEGDVIATGSTQTEGRQTQTSGSPFTPGRRPATGGRK